MIKVQNLRKVYKVGSEKVVALDNINLEIEKGEYIVLCGSNGSGKTTLLRHLKSVLAPHGEKNGEIYFVKTKNLKTGEETTKYHNKPNKN